MWTGIKLVLVMVDLLVTGTRKEGSFLMQEQEYIGYIYITTNLVNNKKYIGQHKSKKFDINYFGSGKLIKEALIKYGKDNFKCEIIEWCTSVEQLDEREIYWIAYYNAVYDDNYYNLHDGGGSGWDYINRCWANGTFIRKPLSEEAKQHMRKPHIITPEGLARWSSKGKHLSNVTKNKLSIALKIARATYAPVWNIGVSPSKDVINKMLKTRKENYAGCIAVKCVETGYIFRSEEDARMWLNSPGAKISDCINGHRDITCGYHWEKIYLSKEELDSVDYTLYEPSKVSWRYIRDKMYFNETTNKYYSSITELNNDGYTRSDFDNIRKICLNNEDTLYKNCKWRFVLINK